MIYDCFLFYNELDVLDIRLNELNDIVDRFVLVESTVTHVNKPKPLYFQQNKKRYAKFLKKITHIVVEDTPDVTLPWIINDYQFSQISRGLKNCKDKDLIIFGDVDEIPNPDKVLEFRKKGKLKVFEQDLSFYYLNFFRYKSDPWLGTRMISYRNFKKYKTPWIAKFSKFDTRVANGGWHFSYMGDIKMIQNKLSSMTHQEFNNDKFNTKENIKKAILEKKDMAGLGYKFRIVDLNLLPAYVQSNEEKFAQILLKERPERLVTKKLKVLFLEIKQIVRIRIFRKVKRFLHG